MIRRRELPALHEAADAIHTITGMRSRYVQALARCFYCKDGIALALSCADPFLLILARDALSLA